MTADTLPGLFAESVRRHAARTALVSGEQVITYRELGARVARAAAALQRLGLRPGDRVSLIAPNSVEWAVAYYAILSAGYVVNPLNSMLTRDEVRFVLRDCGAAAAFASAEQIRRLLSGDGGGDLPALVALDDAGGLPAESFSRMIAAASVDPAPVAIARESLAAICYTSGTTGRPKGAMHSHANVVLNAQLTGLMHGRAQGEVIVTALPLPHVYGNQVMNSAFLGGATLVLLPRFEERLVLSEIARHRATMFDGVPAMYMMLLNSPDLATADLSSLRLCTVGGQTMPVAKMKAVEARFGCPLIEVWGMTELAGLGTTFVRGGPVQHGSIGVPLPYLEARIADQTDPSRTLSDGEAGELVVRGPLVMQGYFGDAQATGEVIDAHGWLRTGDIARRDADGFIYVVDRKKDLILTGGFNVYPAEIERVLAQHPDVVISAVGPVPDEVKGELARAYVVRRAGATVDEAQLIAFCREHLAAYKVPRSVVFVADLPKTSTGKIMRRALRSLDGPMVAHPQ